ncbi:MAG: BREX-1 system phosphatase PglZ type A, partial [Clostridiales bacterium]
SNLMNNMLYRERYDEIAKELSAKLKLAEYITPEKIEQYLFCDGFEIFDTLIIAHLAKVMVDSGKPLTENYREMIKRRGKKCHYANKFRGYYRALSRGDKLISAINNFEQDSAKNADEILESYVKKWHIIDGYYRQFYFAFDHLADGSALMDLRVLVENLYTNGYLSKLSVMWAEKLESISSYRDLTATKQYNFYQAIAQPGSQKECTVVIISDAFRFECGSELHKRFTAKAGAKAELSYMLSVLPSYTRLGMAALLPHKTLCFCDNFDVLVDGVKCQSKQERTAILKTAHHTSAVFSYAEIMAMKRDAVRDAAAGKNLIYIYHDQIDARGDNQATEDEVFNAADEAILEIMALVQKLTVDRSITNYIITADHGFIYKRDKREEWDKINLSNAIEEHMNKRYILSKGQIPKIEGSLTYSMEYLDPALGDYHVTVPRGVDIFKMSGGGQKYVHGGLSLQEVVIPLLRVKTERGKQNIGSVKVALTSLTRKITNLITYFDFIQVENISDTLKPVKLKVYFESESGEDISDEEIIVADKKNVSPEKRQFHEKFTFRNRKYSKTERYYMVIVDMATNVEVERHEFQFDIAFAEDFGFNL